MKTDKKVMPKVFTDEKQSKHRVRELTADLDYESCKATMWCLASRIHCSCHHGGGVGAIREATIWDFMCEGSGCVYCILIFTERLHLRLVPDGPTLECCASDHSDTVEGTAGSG